MDELLTVDECQKLYPVQTEMRYARKLYLVKYQWCNEAQYRHYVTRMQRDKVRNEHR